VDGAHGAHLFFLGNRLYWDVDALVVSAHKTLPAMGQSALLFTNWMEVDRVRQMASVYGSSSPSYPMMASLDTARQWLVEGGRFGYVRASKRVAQLRELFPSVRDGDSLDPCRFVLKVKDGPAFGGQLREQGIFPEMEDSGHVVFICTAQDNEEDFDRLEAVLETLEGCHPETHYLPQAGVEVWISARGKFRPVRLPPILPAFLLWFLESKSEKKSWPICEK